MEDDDGDGAATEKGSVTDTKLIDLFVYYGMHRRRGAIKPLVFIDLDHLMI